MDGFWLGVAFALPLYLVLDHAVIPWMVDRWAVYRRQHAAR